MLALHANHPFDHALRQSSNLAVAAAVLVTTNGTGLTAVRVEETGQRNYDIGSDQ